MATRDLSRTIVEPGRKNGYKHRMMNQRLRCELRTYLARVRQDLEIMEEELDPRHKRLDADNGDNTKPVRRFLRSRVGRPWDEIWSELTARFDRRTLKGWHLLDVHIGGARTRYPEVEPWAVYDAKTIEKFGRPFGGDRVVLSDGTFHEYPGPRYPRTRVRIEREEIGWEQIRRWLRGRAVGRRGAKLLWFHPESHVMTGCSGEPSCPKQHLEHGKRLRRIETADDRQLSWYAPYEHFHRASCRLRQGRTLNTKDIAFWNRLTRREQDTLLADVPDLRQIS